MIKCYFVDVKSISSTVPRSKFKKAEIDRLADAILATDGLLRPLILQQTGVEEYTVIEGHREYYAAVRAKEKDIKKAEMVNAFVIDANSYKSAIEQLDLLTRSQPPTQADDPTPDPQIFADLLAESIDRLLPTITTAISTQLQPIVSQLTTQQQILDAIKLELVNKLKNEDKKTSQTQEKTQLVPEALSKDEPVLESKIKIDGKKKLNQNETLVSPAHTIVEPSKQPDPELVKVAKTTTRNSKKSKSETIPSSPITVVPVEPAKQPAITAIPIKEAKSNQTKQTATGSSIDSDKSTDVLNLMNTLSQSDLTLRMERSGVAKAIIKSVPMIISKRDSQLSQKFETWEDLINSKITGLTASKIPDIIKKLK